MTVDETKNCIAEIIREECELNGYKIVKLILFGSRASGKNNADSDWDFLAVLDKPIEWKQKMKIWLPINRRLARLGVDADILLKSEADFKEDQFDTGKVSYYAYKYGVVA
jgi:predicted nucleotidyltransferase